MDFYTVERIEGKRIEKGVTKYFIKWEGYPRSENTWEPVGNLYCPDLIADFEKREQEKKGRQRKLENETFDIKNSDIPVESFGFERGLVASKILEASICSGRLMFLMSWENTDYVDLVPAKVANKKCPLVVIKFYEERLTWMSDIKKDQKFIKIDKAGN